MKVLLSRDVPKIGRKYDVKEVSDGYALNFLFPKGLAERATSERMRALESARVQSESKREESERIIVAALEKVNGPITLSVPANDKGRLFAALHEADIARALSKECGFEIPTASIVLKSLPHEIGTHAAIVHIGKRDLEIQIVITGAAR